MSANEVSLEQNWLRNSLHLTLKREMLCHWLIISSRDPRGFAIKFYTDDGVWDLVGNNTPIFFVRDPLLFPLFIHTQKRNPATHLKVISASKITFWVLWMVLHMERKYVCPVNVTFLRIVFLGTLYVTPQVSFLTVLDVLQWSCI